MTVKSNKEIYQLWVEAWHTDSRLVEDIADEKCIVHQIRTDGESSTDKIGADALKDSIDKAKVLFDRVTMTVDVGPIEEGEYVSARWTFSGNYLGGMPGAKAEIGKTVAFSGSDFLRIEDGKITEYWVSSDGIYLLEQLKILQ